jgi:hypothetical protein
MSHKKTAAQLQREIDKTLSLSHSGTKSKRRPPPKPSPRDFDRANNAALYASSIAYDAAEESASPERIAALHNAAVEAHLKAAALADASGFSGLAEVRRRSAESHGERAREVHATKKSKKLSATDLKHARGLHVMARYQGRDLLGTIKEVRHDTAAGKARLIVHHFNGEPWPIEPVASAVKVI